ncbi:MAG TPA: CDP-diacylglycerol--glycerol-3-phosphate 3-phosphatidyltransferase, partial [Desulfofustis sp.]|nr:CDP-diacylglycerol--glycerol-3-phosphate 3-phosphatidyltransferase [Desulfofustis sp.]
ADKVLVITALIMLIPLGKIPAIASLVIISREVIITGLRGLAASSGIIVPAGMLGKIKSTLQYLGVGVLLLPVIITGQYEIGRVLVYISLVMALWSGIDYCYRLREVLFKAAE